MHFRDLKAGLSEFKQLADVCVFPTHSFSRTCRMCAAVPNSTAGKETESHPGVVFSPPEACRNAAPGTKSTGVIQLSTGPLPRISPMLSNCVLRTTIECCFIGVISQSVGHLECHREISANLSLASAQPLQVRSMGESSCHAQTCIQTRTSRHIRPP